MAGMIRYPLAYNPILEYWQKIQSKEILVSNKVYRTYKKVVGDIENQGEYFYSPKRANHIIEFAENYCRHSKGKFGGKSVQLELWEKAHLAAIFGFVDIEGNRKYRESLLIVGKKLSDERENLVFMLWGAYAKEKAALINSSRHLILTTVHPSPRSAEYGFFGCRHFSKANDFLRSRGIQEIDW